MFFGRIGRLETQDTGDFCSGGGGTGVGHGALDEFQNLLLPLGQFGAVSHVSSLGRVPDDLSSNCIFNQFHELCKHFQKTPNGVLCASAPMVALQWFMSPNDEAPERGCRVEQAVLWATALGREKPLMWTVLVKPVK
jgi:hypothetical protein